MCMRLILFAVLVAITPVISAMAQTISGYTDGEPPLNPHGDSTTLKTKWLGYPGEPINGLQAVLRLATNTFRVDSTIEVEILFKNVSTNEVAISAAFPLLANGFNVQILDKDKKTIPLTGFGKAQQVSGGASPNLSRRLSPGSEMVVSLELRKLYQLESPGIYLIQVTRLLPSSATATKVPLATGVAEITILPSDRKK